MDAAIISQAQQQHPLKAGTNGNKAGTNGNEPQHWDGTEPGSLLPDFCANYAGRCRGILVPYAAEVVVICHMGSLALAAEYFSERFGRKMSTKPIRDVLERVRAGIIPCTQDEIQAAANLHPLARRFLEKAPWAANPKMADKAEASAPKRKPGRPKKSNPISVETRPIDKGHKGTSESCEFLAKLDEQLGIDPEDA